MPFADEPEIIDSQAAFSPYAAAWIESFFKDVDAALGADVCLRYHGRIDFPDPQPERQPPIFLIGRREKQRLILHVCEDRLVGTPLPALQAALDMELAIFTLDRSWNAFAFNFKKEILYSLNASGSAVHVIRKIVWHLENALKLQSATHMILGLNRGRAQVFYYLYVLNRSQGDGQDYGRMQPHDWVRGLYLCQKSEVYLSIFLLQQAGLSPELVSFWDQCHPFLVESDRRFLDRLARQTSMDDALPFAARVVQMFALARSHLSI